VRLSSTDADFLGLTSAAVREFPMFSEFRDTPDRLGVSKNSAANPAGTEKWRESSKFRRLPKRHQSSLGPVAE
jgi:hypothetical protein